MTGLLRLHEEVVQPEWIDYNGHLNEAYYLLIFSHATDAFMDEIGLDAAARETAGVSVYTLQNHLSYLEEVGAGAVSSVATQLLGHDAKRMHLFHSLYDKAEDRLLCECETLLLHVDMAGPRAAPFAPEVLARLDAIAAAQVDLPRPERAGRSIGLRR